MSWLSWLTERTRRSRFNRGYDYAAGQLLTSNGNAETELRNQVESANVFHDSDQFDAGIQRALQHWQEVKLTNAQYLKNRSKS